METFFRISTTWDQVVPLLGLIPNLSKTQESMIDKVPYTFIMEQKLRPRGSTFSNGGADILSSVPPSSLFAETGAKNVDGIEKKEETTFPKQRSPRSELCTTRGPAVRKAPWAAGQGRRAGRTRTTFGGLVLGCIAARFCK